MIWLGFTVEDFSKPEMITFKLMESFTYEVGVGYICYIWNI